VEQCLLSSDLQMLQRNVRSFVKNFVLPAEQNQRRGNEEFGSEVVNPLRRRAREMGLWGLGVKKEWGGAGLSMFEQVVLLEEAVQHDHGFYSPCLGAFGPEFPAFLEQCTDEQNEKYIKPAIQSGSGVFVAIWEDVESNNLENIQCYAKKSEDHWILNGVKSYIANLQDAKVGVVLANGLLDSPKTLPTLFMIEKDSFADLKDIRLMNVRSAYAAVLKDCRVDDGHRIGEVGEGIKIMSSWIAESQIYLAAKGIGIAKKALGMTKNYILSRVTRGKVLADFPAVQTMMAESIAELKASRFLVWDAALCFDQNAAERNQSARIAKLIAVDAAFHIIDRCLQLHGGAGFSRDLPFERWYKELRIARSVVENSITLQQKIAVDALAVDNKSFC
jgi:acyl-CoA dehydrogenase